MKHSKTNTPGTGKTLRNLPRRPLTKRDKIFIAVGAVVILLTFPLLFSEWNSGAVGGTLLGLFFVCVGLSGLTFKRAFGCSGIKNRGLKTILRVLSGIVLTGFVYATLCSAFVVYKAVFPKYKDGDVKVVIILGCHVKGDEPGPSLKKRIDRGYEVLTQNENAVCILTGGKGEGENVTEAEAMKKALVSMGIAEERLILEEKATTTEENVRYSSEIIKAKGLSSDVVVVTQSYHQARASLFCKKYGLSSSPANAESNIYPYPSYFIRELFGITHAAFYGY